MGGNEVAAWAGARELWLSPTRLEMACNRLFETWQKSGGLTPALRRQRLDLALHTGNMEFAEQLAASLPEAERSRAALWREIHKRPSTLIDNKALQKDNGDNRELIVHGLKRLARSDARKAAELWREYESRYAFSEIQRADLLNNLVMGLAFDGDASALDWFAQIPVTALQPESRQWAIRVALRHQRWDDALAILKSLPPNERRDEEWQYWTARSFEGMGEKELAKSLGEEPYA